VVIAADWLRQDFDRNPKPSARLTLTVFRLGQLVRGRARRHPLRILFAVLNLLWTRGVAGADLPAEVTAGPGLRLPHGGLGLVVHANCRLGAGVTLYQHVTLGVAVENSTHVPVLEDDVYVGAGAIIIGGVRIGKGARIGAGAVVNRNVAPGETVVGAQVRSFHRPVERA
jgi:serine acetyltransferase